MTIEKHLFRLDVRIEKLPPMKIDVIDTVTAGRDPRCDLTLSGEKIKNRHLVFMQKGENLALHYLGNTNQTFLNSLPLEEDKVYLLEPGDKIALTGVEIIIKHELVHVAEGHHTVKPIIFNSLDDLKPESIKEGLIFKDNPTGSLREQKHIQPPLLKAPPKKEKAPSVPVGSFLNLWAVKIYAMVADIFFTYLILVVAIPLIPMVTAETIVLKILNFFASLVFLTGRHSFIKFLIAWYFLSFAQTMIFGTTISQFLLGLRNKNDKTYGRLILFRMKTFLFSLFLLPAQNMVSQKLFFKGIRKVGMVIIMGFILASPLFLPPPFNKSVTLMKDVTAYERELRTKTIASFSAALKMNLKTDISTRYLLLPVIYKSTDMRAFEFFDLESNQSIIIYQDKKISYEDLDRELEYANPLYDFFHTTTLVNMALRNQKEIIANALLISPEHLKTTLPKSGPFFGSQVLLKEHLLDAGSSNETVLKTYAPETPVMFIAGTQQDYFYLFTPDGIDRFVIENPGRGAMVSVFENEVMTKLLRDPDIIDIKGNPRSGILEAQDAFLQGEEGPLLTYYINVANSLSNLKVVHNDKDLTAEAKRAVIKNIESVQKFIKVKNNYKSFDDIKNQLTPMENPGVKR